MTSYFVSICWLLLFVGGVVYLAYQRVDLRTSTVALGLALLAYTIFGNGWWLWLLLLWALFGVMIIPNLVELRREKITRPLLEIYRKMLPTMSDTEREALEAGNVWWDGELFSGMPEWDRLMSFPAPELSDEEQAFVDGPCEQLCQMLDDWDICHERADMPKEVWDYIIEQRFFAMIIPKQYGGLEFSAYANAIVIAKLASRSPTAPRRRGRSTHQPLRRVTERRRYAVLHPHCHLAAATYPRAGGGGFCPLPEPRRRVDGLRIHPPQRAD